MNLRLHTCTKLGTHTYLSLSGLASMLEIEWVIYMAIWLCPRAFFTAMFIHFAKFQTPAF